MPRKPSQIAFDIRHEMNAYLLSDKCKPGKIPTWITYAKPYINAMLELRSIEDRYYLDSGYEICLRARCNLTNWRGERARALKAELDDLLKSCPESKHL
jgi:hypothetical protein